MHLADLNVAKVLLLSLVEQLAIRLLLAKTKKRWMILGRIFDTDPADMAEART